MKLAVYGAGAIGSYLAAALTRAGADVTVIARGPQLDAIRKNGITLISEILPVKGARQVCADTHGAGSVGADVFADALLFVLAQLLRPWPP
jgi:ketopantoate reductase